MLSNRIIFYYFLFASVIKEQRLMRTDWNSTSNRASRQALGKDSMGPPSWFDGPMLLEIRYSYICMCTCCIYNEIFILMWRTPLPLSVLNFHCCGKYKRIENQHTCTHTKAHVYALTLTQMVVRRVGGIIRITGTTSDNNLRLLEVKKHVHISQKNTHTK